MLKNPIRVVLLTLGALAATVCQVMAWGAPSVPKPSSVISSAQKTAEHAKHAEQALVSSAANVESMHENVTSVKELVHDSSGNVWTDAVRSEVDSGLKTASGLAYLQKIPNRTGLDKEIWESTSGFSAVVKALAIARTKFAAAGVGTAEKRKWANRMTYLEPQYNYLLQPLLSLLGKLDPLAKIEEALQKSAPGADVSMGQDPSRSIKTYLEQASGSKGNIDEILKPIAHTPRTVQRAVYRKPEGHGSIGATDIVNDLIAKNQGLFVKIAPHPQAGCAKDLFGDPAYGETKVVWIKDHNNKEYFWSESQEVNFLLPPPWSNIGTGWDFKFVTASDKNNLFAVKENGKLLHYRFDEGNRTWSIGGKEVGAGWQQFVHVFAGPNNVLYANCAYPVDSPRHKM